MKLCPEIIALQRKMYRVETLLWYVAGAISLKFGGELVPIAAAMIG